MRPCLRAVLGLRRDSLESVQQGFDRSDQFCGPVSRGQMRGITKSLRVGSLQRSGVSEPSGFAAHQGRQRLLPSVAL